MDEIWQRHKAFILQCVIGGFVFLIALVVMGNAYSGIEQVQQGNINLMAQLKKRMADKTAPSPSSIDAQKQKAEKARGYIRDAAMQVASLAQGEDYVRENLVWILAIIGKPPAEAERFITLYRQFPGTCLTSIREEARTVLVGRAAQKGKQIDESFGLAGVADEDVPGALHALAITCDVIHRCLEREGITAVLDIRVNPRNTLDRDLTWISGVDVRLSMHGDPDDVGSVLRTFNQTMPPANRMTVLREIESIVRKTPDDDDVKASVVLVGLQHRGAQGESQ